jgi:hypothetical protein
LKTPEFHDSVGFLLPPGPLRKALQRSTDVRRIVSAMRYREISEDEFRAFVSELLRDFRPDEAFPHDLALAALAAAVEHSVAPIADEYLIDLARLKAPELISSVRVARECLKARYELPATETRTFRYPSRLERVTSPSREPRRTRPIPMVRRRGRALKYSAEASHATA